MKSLASETKPFQSRCKGGAGQAKRTALKQAFLIDSDAELVMYLIQSIRFSS